MPAGLPAELLERRLDVAAAERRVASAFYLVGEAEAARLPRIALNLSASSISSELVLLKDRDNPAWSLGAGITAPIFLGGALKAQVDIRTAEQRAAVADYGRIGAQAFAEVENALSSGFTLDRRIPILEASVAENDRALELAAGALSRGHGRPARGGAAAARDGRGAIGAHARHERAAGAAREPAPRPGRGLRSGPAAPEKSAAR